MGEKVEQVTYLINQMGTDQERINFLKRYLVEEQDLSDEDKKAIQDILDEYLEKVNERNNRKDAQEEIDEEAQENQEPVQEVLFEGYMVEGMTSPEEQFKEATGLDFNEDEYEIIYDGADGMDDGVATPFKVARKILKEEIKEVDSNKINIEDMNPQQALEFYRGIKEAIQNGDNEKIKSAIKEIEDMFNRINNNTSKILKDGQINEEILDNIISNLEEITRENSYDNWSQGWGDEERDDGTASAHYGPMDNENKSWSQGWEDEERDDGTVSAHYGPMNDEIKWNSKLTPEQIDELKAEGLEPGDPEYDQYLLNHGIKPEKIEEEKKEEIKWNPNLTKEQIDELKAEGLRPGDPEYDQYLLNHGIKSEVNKEENNVVKNQIDVLKKKIADLEQKHLDAKTMEEKQKLMEEIQKARDELSSLRKGEKNPEQQNENKPKDDFQPPAVIEDKKGQTNVKEDEKGSKLPIRSFWEIYNDTKTEHCGTIGRMMYQMAHMPILPSKNDDTMHKLLSIVTIPGKLVLKPIAAIANAINRTDAKMNALRENINNLTPEEFAVLTQTADKANMKFNQVIKAGYDNDYLDPNFMKQHKTDNLYLDAVKERMSRETNETVTRNNAAIEQINQNINSLLEMESRTQEQEQLLFTLTNLRTLAENDSRNAVNDLKIFENGAKEKSSAFRNISGWIAGRYNPDTREADAQMAEMAKQRRETENITITNDMKEFEQSQTNIKQILWNPNNKIDIGKYSIESPVELLNKGQQTKGKLLFANIAVGAAVMSFIENMKNQARVDEAINAHNSDIANTNAKNQNLHQDNNNGIDQELINRAKDDVTNTKTAAAHAGGEYANLDKYEVNGWSKATSTQGYKDADDLLHATTNNVNGSQSLEEATKFFDNVKGAAIPIHQNYAAAHPNFDYSGYLSALQNTDSSAIVELFNQLEKINFTNLGATMQSTMNGVDLSNISELVIAALAGAKLAETIQKENEQNKNINNEISRRTQNQDRNEENNQTRTEDEEER